ncbi:MAG: DUF6600 domain-containing protein [Casimicrobiaceae bacterium]
MTTRGNVFARWLNVVAFVAAMLPVAVSYAQAPNGGTDADPSDRVGRLSSTNGEVSFSAAGSDEWVQAQLNRPIVPGDRLWADNNSRAELAVDNSTWWLGEQTSVTVSNLDDNIVQMQVHEGTLDVRVRRLPAGNIVEIDTPNLAFSVTRPGRYRVDVDPHDGSTNVVVREGSGDVYGENASYVVASGQAYRFYGTDLGDNELIAVPAVDAFERWTLERDGRYDRVTSARYVSPEVVGYEDLDSYGTWSPEATYGTVWFPRSVRSGWAPYSDGRWSWIDPWGWTWVDEQPWGFAPFHYGRWAHFNRGWGWVPGSRTLRPVYAPALVAFVGGAGFSLSVSSGPAIGWFPLAPREVYVPAYRVSRNYFRQINVSNTVVNVTNITNIYNNPTRIAQVDYVNRLAPNAVTAVPPAAFAQSQNVSRVAIAMPAAAIQQAEVHPVARVAPARPALVGAAPAARAKPPAAVMQRAVVAKVPPPPPPVADARKLQALEKNPGRPLDHAELQTLRRATPPAAAAPPAVRVVEQAKPKPNAAPPARAADGTGSRGTVRTNAPPAGIVAPGRANERAATPERPEAGPAAKGPPAGRGPEAPSVRPPSAAAAQPNQPEARGPSAARPTEALPNGRGPTSRAAPTGPERNVPATATRPSGTSAPAPAAAVERGAPSVPAQRATPAEAPVARPPEARGAERSTVRGRPEGGPPGQAARPPESRSTPAPQIQRAPEERPAPQRAPEARAAPQQPSEARPQPQRSPETRAAPAPETRPQPQRPPEARPQPRRPPETPAAPPRPPEARPQPQQRPPAPRPEQTRPPQAQPQAPEAHGAPPPQPERPQARDDRGKGNDKKDQNPGNDKKDQNP